MAVPTVAIKPPKDDHFSATVPNGKTPLVQSKRNEHTRHPDLEPLSDLPNVVIPGRFGFKTYGADAVQVITENLYRLARDIRGFGFKSADAIAMKLGIEKIAMIRLRAGVSLRADLGDGRGSLRASYGPIDPTLRGIARSAEGVDSESPRA